MGPKQGSRNGINGSAVLGILKDVKLDASGLFGPSDKKTAVQCWLT